MNSPLANVSALFMLLLIARTSYARLAPDNYWHIMKNEPMPETVQELIDMRNSVSPLFNKKTDCETTISYSRHEDTLLEDDVHEKPVVDESDSVSGGTIYHSDPVPDITIYHDNSRLKGMKKKVDNSEPIPDITIYHDDSANSHLKVKKSTFGEVEPVPDVTIYHDAFGLKGKKSAIDNSEPVPVPDITIYHDDSANSYLKVKKSIFGEVEPAPDITIYHDAFGLKGKKSAVDDSEPVRVPDITIYHDDSANSHLKVKKSTFDEVEPVPDITIYQNDLVDSRFKVKKSTVGEVEPVPDITIYHG